MLYIREIGRVKLLTPQQEIELAARIKSGDREARDEMIKSNLPLVVRIARDYEGLGVPLLDLIGAGNVGLVKAIERFDPNKGAKFSTYGALWIKKAITHLLANQAKPVRLPVYLVERLGRMSGLAWRFRERFGRDATDTELAAEMGITPLQITEMRLANSRPASLDAPINGEDSWSYGEVIPDERIRMPYEDLEDEALLAAMRESFDTLDKREKAVLRARFGLTGEQPRTLAEVGQELRMTGERVRQIQNVALKKLRRRINKLEPNGVGR